MLIDDDADADAGWLSVTSTCSPWLGMWHDVYSTWFLVPPAECVSSWHLVVLCLCGHLFLTVDTGFVCVPHGDIGNIPCYWYSLGHLWTSYIQWCSDFSNRKCCAQYTEPETPKRGYGQCLGYNFYSKPTGSDDVIRSYFGVRIAVCACSDWSPYSSLSLFGLQSQWDFNVIHCRRKAARRMCVFLRITNGIW